MGRPPLGKVAMSDSERHRRYMARLRQRAAAATALAPTPTPSTAPNEGLVLRLSHIGLYPDQITRFD